MKDKSIIMYRDIIENSYCIPNYWSRKDFKFSIKYANQFAVRLKQNGFKCCKNNIHFFVLKEEKCVCAWCGCNFENLDR